MSTEQTVEHHYATITPYMIVENTLQFIEFLKNVFNAKQDFIQMRDENNVMHAGVHIGNSLLMVADPLEGYPPYPTSIYLFMDDCDTYYNNALQAGSTSIEMPTNHPYGHRRGGVKDPYGNTWWIAAPVK
jgi:PhnB protein